MFSPLVHAFLFVHNLYVAYLLIYALSCSKKDLRWLIKFVQHKGVEAKSEKDQSGQNKDKHRKIKPKGDVNTQN